MYIFSFVDDIPTLTKITFLPSWAVNHSCFIKHMKKSSFDALSYFSIKIVTANINKIQYIFNYFCR